VIGMNIDYITEGKAVLYHEAMALREVAGKLDENFATAIKLLNECQGKVIVTGIGKSGIVGRKIASTLASTGRAGFFLHATEARHGDLGAVNDKDIVILISKSGETQELVDILPSLRLLGAKTIGIIGNPESTLGKKCDITINVGVSSEVEPNSLAPTASSTAALAVGDALAIVLAKMGQFQPEDFGKLHPGGTLGKRLTMTVDDLMYKGDRIPKVFQNATIMDVMLKFTDIGLGIAAIVDANDGLLGIFTDGDLRRLLQREHNCFNMEISMVMNRNPKTIGKNELAFNALGRMRDFAITALIVTEANNKVIGVINVHDILRAGIN
jgi:arabinose-5-phosphate isomerase